MNIKTVGLITYQFRSLKTEQVLQRLLPERELIEQLFPKYIERYGI